MALRTVGVRLTAEISEYTSNLKKAGQTARDFKGELDNASKKGNLDKVADQAAVVGVGLTGMAAYAIKSAADFDKAMSSVAAATHAPANEMDQLRAAALKAGKDTMYSATEAADGITQLSKAGISTADILKGGLNGALSLAAAGQISVGEAAETAASAMTQFKLSGDQVPHVADLLAAAAGKAQGGVHELGYALSQSGLVASQFGLSVEDTTGVLAEFASAGLLGSDAGTSLKTMLLALANPTTKTANLMKDLGISFYDAQGRFIGLSGVAQVLQTRLKGLTDEQRQQALGQIFGNDAIRSASILYTDGAKGVEKWKNAVNDAGYASATAQKQTDNLAGDLERLRGSIETVAIQAGSGGNSGLRMFVKLLNDVVNQFADMNPITSSVLVGIAGVSGALLLGGAAWIKYRKVVAEAQEQLIATGPAGEKAATALGKLSSALGALGTISVVGEGMTMLFNSIDTHTPDVDKLTSSLQNLVQTGQTAGALKTDFGANLKGLGDIAQTADDATHGVSGFIVKLDNSLPVVGAWSASITNLAARLGAGTDWSQATQQMQALDQAMTNFMGTTNDAKQASELWNKVLLQSGLDTDQLAKLLPGAYKKVGELNTAADKSKGALGGAASKLGDLNSALQVGADAENQYKTKADAVAGAVRGQADAFISLAKALRSETDPAFAFISAQEGMKKAQEAATKAVREHGKASSQAKEANKGLVDAALTLQDAAGRAAATLDGKMDPALAATLQQAGLTKAQIKAVSGELQQAKKDADKYTGKYPADISAPGAVQAKKQIDDAYRSAKILDGQYEIALKTTGQGKVEAELRKLSSEQQALKSGNTIARLGGGMATGGPVFGAGTATSDSVPAMLSNGEHVWTAAEVQAAGGHGAVMAMRSMALAGSTPKYAAGGPVAWPYPVTAAMTKIPTEAQALSKILGSAGGGNLGAWIMEGIRLAGVPASWGGPLRTLIMRESGGNPRSINLWDSNAKAGDPSRGLMQTIGATFEHYRLRSLPDDIYNPVANIVAGIRYIESRYGSIFNVQQANPNLPPKGYANGGWITEPVVGVGASGRTYTFAEQRPEYVTPHWQTAAHTRGSGDTHLHFSFSGPVGSRYELENWLTGALSNLRKSGRV